ncbi:MAG: prop effector, partial [Burkholderiales bacterium]|nr:prop effector [Burkholderiales bacterium]
MTTSTLSAEPTQADAPTQAPAPATRAERTRSVQPVLEKLFELYPHLFGAEFLPLKLGIFQELLARHPDQFKRDSLKAALGVHTRSTRYLQSVAAGKQRHDLDGAAVEPVA